MQIENERAASPHPTVQSKDSEPKTSKPEVLNPKQCTLNLNLNLTPQKAPERGCCRLSLKKGGQVNNSTNIKRNSQQLYEQTKTHQQLYEQRQTSQQLNEHRKASQQLYEQRKASPQLYEPGTSQLPPGRGRCRPSQSEAAPLLQSMPQPPLHPDMSHVDTTQPHGDTHQPYIRLEADIH